MIEVLKIVSMPVPAGAQPAGGTTADAGDPATLDFSQLLGAGMGRNADPALPGSVLPADATQTADPAAAGEDPKDDAEAILNAIAAQLPLDARQVATAPVTPAGGPQLPAQSSTTSAARNSAPVEDATMKNSRPEQRTINGTDEGRARPAPRAESSTGKFDLPAAIRQTPEHGAAGQLRAEMAAQAIPESQSATHLLLSHQPQHALREAAAARIEQLPQPLGTPGWNEGFADRVVWMAKNEIQTAELRLNPAELGPIDVTLTLSGDDKMQATVQFSAAHASTREAIETALPRLREMMQESGITLGQAGVDANTSQAADGERRQQGGNQQGGRMAAQSEVATGTVALPAGTRSQGRGLVDTFA